MLSARVSLRRTAAPLYLTTSTAVATPTATFATKAKSGSSVSAEREAIRLTKVYPPIGKPDEVLAERALQTAFRFSTGVFVKETYELDEISTEAVAIMSSFTPNSLRDLLTAYAANEYAPAGAVDAVAAQLTAQWSKLDGSHHASVAKSLATLGAHEDLQAKAITAAVGSVKADSVAAVAAAARAMKSLPSGVLDKLVKVIQEHEADVSNDAAWQVVAACEAHAAPATTTVAAQSIATKKGPNTVVPRPESKGPQRWERWPVTKGELKYPRPGYSVRDRLADYLVSHEDEPPFVARVSMSDGTAPELPMNLPYDHPDYAEPEVPAKMD